MEHDPVAYDAAAAAACQIINLYMQEHPRPKNELFAEVLFVILVAIEAAEKWRRDAMLEPSRN